MTREEVTQLHIRAQAVRDNLASLGYGITRVQRDRLQAAVDAIDTLAYELYRVCEIELRILDLMEETNDAIEAARGNPTALQVLTNELREYGWLLEGGTHPAQRGMKE